MVKPSVILKHSVTPQWPSEICVVVSEEGGDNTCLPLPFKTIQRLDANEVVRLSREICSRKLKYFSQCEQRSLELTMSIV